MISTMHFLAAEDIIPGIPGTTLNIVLDCICAVILSAILVLGSILAWKLLFHFPEYRARKNRRSRDVLVDYLHPKMFLPSVVIAVLLEAGVYFLKKSSPEFSLHSFLYLTTSILLAGFLATRAFFSAAARRHGYDADDRAVYAKYGLECNVALLGGVFVWGFFPMYLVLAYMFGRDGWARSRVYSFTGYNVTDDGLKYFYVATGGFLAMVLSSSMFHSLKDVVGWIVGIGLVAWAVIGYFSRAPGEREKFVWTFLIQVAAAGFFAAVVVWLFLIKLVFSFLTAPRSERPESPAQGAEKQHSGIFDACGRELTVTSSGGVIDAYGREYEKGPFGGYRRENSDDDYTDSPWNDRL